MMKFNKWTTKKLNDQDLADNTLHLQLNRVFGTILIALSGVILFFDKVFGFFNISFGIPEQFQSIGWDFNTFVWFMAQTISPILLIIGGLLKHYKIAYIMPLYFYILQLYYVLFDFKIIDDGYYMIYSLGVTVVVMLIIYTIKTITKKHVISKIEKEKKRLLDELH